jgi:hypothetical protein
MPFVIQALISLAISYALTAMNKPKPQKPTAGDLEGPEVRPGALLGVSFGTNWRRDPLVVDYFGARAEPIEKSVGK